MEEYAQIVIDSFPYMLNQETKQNASLTIASYMNTMLRKAQTEEELMIFAETLDKCKTFAKENKLGGLLRTCDEWNHKGLEKYDEIRGVKKVDDNQNNNSNYNSEVAAYVQSVLDATSAIINKVGRINTGDFQIASDKLDNLEASLVASGDQYLTQEQISYFKQEILKQKEQIEMNYAMIDEILESSHMSR